MQQFWSHVQRARSGLALGLWAFSLAFAQLNDENVATALWLLGTALFLWAALDSWRSHQRLIAMSIIIVNGLAVAYITMLYFFKPVLDAAYSKTPEQIQRMAWAIADAFSRVPTSTWVVIGLALIWQIRGRIRSMATWGSRGLFIVSATYGIGERTIDVTQMLRALVKANHVSVEIENDNLGQDPAPNTPKQLTVTYEWQGHQEVRTVQEHDTLTLP